MTTGMRKNVVKHCLKRVGQTNIIAMNDVYWGGELRGGKRGRGSENKTPFVAAVSIDNQGHPIAMNMNVVEGFRSKEIARWAKQHSR